MPHKFLPFSRYVFLDMNNILVIGGMDDTHRNTCDFFTNYVYEMKVMRFNLSDEVYICQPRSAMLNGRGCFGVCYTANFVYVFGGVTGRDFNYLLNQKEKREEDSHT